MSLDFRDELRQTLYDQFLTNFPTEYGAALPIQLENQKFGKVDTPFLSAYIYYVSGQRASIGTSKKFQRHDGFFCIECQVPEDTGMATLWLMAGAVERAMPEQQLQLGDGSYVSLHTSKVTRNTSQDGWYFVTVMIPFCLDVCIE